jgi:RHS repeat-associated protein
MSRSTTSNYADTLSWVPFGWDVFPIGVLEQEWGLADLNGDGLPDLVDSTPQGCTTSRGLTEQCWTVYFSFGREFSGPIQWRFAGDWQTQHGADCDRVYGFPRLSRSVYGQTAEEQGDNPRIVQGRQVQTVADVNGDGMLDYVYESPAPVNDSDAYCDYINPSSNFQTAEEISQRVGPYRLHRKILVRLNDGAGFGPPIDWVDTRGYALSGVTVVGEGDRPTDVTSYAALGVGDFDADGAPDLGVRGDGDWYNLPGDADINRLYKLGEANADALEGATAPDGGRLEIEYRYQRPDPHMAGGQWVTAAVRMVDLDPGRLDVTRRYFYEGGSYDRERRSFQGFERVYQVTDGADGYTLSRYYQSPGFEGHLYCRAVRRLAGAADAIDALTQERAEAWAATPLGQHRDGWVAPVAIGDAAHADALSGPLALTDDAGDLAAGDDVPEASDGAYGPTPPPATDDPAEEAAEEERSEIDERTPPPVDDPVWPPPESSDVTGLAAGAPPVDVFLPGQTLPWHREDAPGLDWWDVPTYSSDCAPGSAAGASFVCDPAQIDPAALACGDAGDPGALVVEDFSVLGDFSTIPDIHTVRPRVASKRSYDPSGRSPRVTASELDYDDRGNVVTRRDAGDLSTAADDLVTRTAYKAPDEAAHVIGKPCIVTVADSSGATLSRTRSAYDGAAGFSCSATVSVGDVTMVERSVDAATTVIDKYLYSPEGLVTSHTDPRGDVTTTAYDAFFPWFPVSESHAVVNASGPATLTAQRRWLGVNRVSLTHFGLVGEEVDAGGDVTTRTYDAFDRPVALIRPGDSAAAPTERWTYHDWSGDPADRRTEAWTRRFDAGLEVTITTTRDGFGQVERVDAPPPDNLLGCAAGCTAVTQELTYDADGRIVESRHPYFSNSAADAKWTRTTYDLLGRVTGVTGPNGARTVTAYDRDLTTVVDPDGLVTVTRSDVRGNPTGVYRYTGGGATLYSGVENTYRPDGLLSGSVDAAGNRWSFSYDQLGRQTSVDDANTGVKSVVYHPDGNVAVVTDGRYATLGLAMAMAYDALDRPVLREVRLGATVSGTTIQGGVTNERTLYWYDVDPALFAGAALACPDNHLGRLSRVVQWLKTGTLTEVSRKEYCYDDRGRVTEMAHTIAGTTYRTAYTYGSADQVLTEEYPDGDVVAFTYDASGRMAETGNAAGPLLAASEAQADGQPVRRVFGSGGIKQRLCYEDGAGGAILARAVVGGSAMRFGCAAGDGPVTGSIYDVRYQRSPAGRILARDEAFERPRAGREEHAATYGYDGVFRLASETYDGVTTAFEHDELDNLTAIGGEAQGFGASGRPLRGAGPNAVLDGAGGRTFSYDAAGAVLAMTSGGVQFGFGRAFDGQPLLVTRNGIPDAAVYYYDEAGRRVLRARGGDVRRYAGPFQDDGGTTRSFYPGGGVKVGGEQYYTVSDPAGSTALVLDNSGAVVQYTSYEPNGGLREDVVFDPDPADGITPYRTDVLYDGKERDDTFGADDVYDFGPRMYSADVGTWLAPDPTYSDGLNRYAFVQGDPVNGWDPTGTVTYKGWGHHVVVQELYRGADSPYSGKFTKEVMDTFDRWTTGPLEVHNFDAAHARYNEAVIGEVAEFGELIGKPDTMNWTVADAEDFVVHVHMSDKPAIQGYLDFVAEKIGPMSPNQARQYATALRKGDRYLARWMIAARRMHLPTVIGAALGGLAFWSYVEESHGNVQMAWDNFRIDTTLDIGTLGLLAPTVIAHDNLDFQLEDYAERWEAWQAEEFPECQP